MREVMIAGVFVLALFFAGGVYSQLVQSQAVDESIQRGMDYLAAQPVLDSELLVLHIMKQSAQGSPASAMVEKNENGLDSYQYPLQQFLKGETIEESKFHPDTLGSAYNRNFVKYFSCYSLSSEWLDEIEHVTEGKEFEAYDAAHSLLLFQLIKNDYFGGRCGDQPEFLDVLNEKIKNKVVVVQSQLLEKDNFDAWVQRVAVLGFAGESVSQEEVDFILSAQTSSGGWKPASYYPDDESSPHTTALAVWALWEASHE